MVIGTELSGNMERRNWIHYVAITSVHRENMMLASKGVQSAIVAGTESIAGFLELPSIQLVRDLTDIAAMPAPSQLTSLTVRLESISEIKSDREYDEVLHHSLVGP